MATSYRKSKIRDADRPIVLFFVIVILLLVIASPWLHWLYQPPGDVVTAVYNKTVPDKTMHHHGGILWFLKHMKQPPAQGGTFSYLQDYYGFFPEGDGAFSIRTLPILPEHTDVLYIADTYGVYRGTPGYPPRVEGESNLIYGGLTHEDIEVMREFLNRERPNTLIAEYNTFGSPTHPSVQTQAYEMFRTRWTGWTGQYVADLSRGAEVLDATIGQYEKYHQRAWEYSGPGFLFVEDERSVMVLKLGEDIGSLGCQMSFTGEGEKILGLSGSRYYNHIFDIVEPMKGAEVLAEYRLDVTEPGREKLEKAGIPEVFPAVIMGNTAYHRTYYLAGNFAYLPYIPLFHAISWVPSIMERAVTDSLESENSFYWGTYIPMLTSIYREASQRRGTEVPQAVHHTSEEDGTTMVSRTQGTMIQVFREGQWQDFFIYGVNIGIAMPGNWFTDFPRDKSLYYRWLSLIGEMNINTVRIYTLLDPEFYKALSLYNRLNPQNPLWLMQEIWPEEEPPGYDYLTDDYREEFQEEIRHVIDAVHGNAVIPPRPGRAYGTYTADVSPYILGYLVGRELEPNEVEATDLLNPGFTFSGNYLYALPQASPTEAWLAESCDYVLAYQEEVYGWQHPVAIVNWPTLDALEHDSERDEFGIKDKEWNDRAVVDINNINIGEKMKAGLFGAYHIYPNYPDFMNNEPSYDLYYDDQGRFRYGGYLREFMEIHTKYPAVIAEFGLATGMGNAHYSPDGYHHGSMTETVQGEGIIRMFETMETEGYAGGIIFEWMDEWAKKTWTTEPYMIPYDRQILWHNAIDPEQNYGILALEAVKPARPGASGTGDGAVSSVELRIDASYLHIDIDLSRRIDFAKEQLIIGLDTYDRERGEIRYREDLPYRAPSGMEYTIILDGKDTSRLLVIPPYNSASYRFSSHPSLMDTGVFEPMSKLINRARALSDGTPIPAIFEDSSALRYGDLTGSTNNWIMDGRSISLKIPWGRINVSDPSEGRVLDDNRMYYSDPLRDVLSTQLSDGIAVSMILVQNFTDRLLDTFPGTGTFVIQWAPWNQPVYQERLKESYGILQEYLKHRSIK